MDLEQLLVSYIKQTKEAIPKLKEMTGLDIEPYDIQQALAEKLLIDDEYQLVMLGLTKDQIIKELEDFNFKKYKPETLLIAKLDESILPDNIEQRFVEAQFKHEGEIWVVHKNDADPFPSDPHAHCYEKGLKLHLGTGDLYLGAKLVGTIAKKNFLALREKMSSLALPELQV